MWSVRQQEDSLFEHVINILDSNYGFENLNDKKK